MSSVANTWIPPVYKPTSVILFVLTSIFVHTLLVGIAYRSGAFTSDIIESIPARTISVLLVEPTPVEPIIPVQQPIIEEVKKKVVTQAPVAKKVAQKTIQKTKEKPKPVKKEPVRTKQQPIASPLPTPVKKPIVFSTPQPSYQPKPRYPSIAKRRGIEGIVIFEISVANNGHVNNAFIIQSSGSSVLDKSALKAIKTWRFPASKFNSLSNFKQKIEFRLNQY
ncbi:MAG: TonB family protein [Cycloclasticus sp.]